MSLIKYYYTTNVFWKLKREERGVCVRERCREIERKERERETQRDVERELRERESNVNLVSVKGTG